MQGKFKVGDKVMCTYDTCYSNVFVGNEYTVDRLTDLGNLVLRNDSGLVAHGHPYASEHFDLVTREVASVQLPEDFTIMKKGGNIVFSLPVTASKEDALALVEFLFKKG